MAFIHIAVVGTDHEPILMGVRELGADKVILIGEEDQREQAAKLGSVLSPLGVETEWRAIEEGGMLLGTIRLVQELVREHKDRRHEIVINLGAADKSAACATLSAGFVAGVKVVDMPEDELVFLPVLRFSYDEVVSEAKIALLRALDGMGGEVEKLRDLADEAGLQDSLASYHIRGGRDGKGLTELGLVDVDRGTRGALTIRLTPMGELLARGMDV